MMNPVESLLDSLAEHADSAAKKVEKACKVCSSTASTFNKFKKSLMASKKKDTLHITPVLLQDLLLEKEYAVQYVDHYIETGVALNSYYFACPPDLDTLGRSGWTFIHTVAAYYPQHPSPAQQEAAKNFLESISILHPCEHCGLHMQNYIEEHPITVATQEELINWTCSLHNTIATMQGKPTFDCEQTLRRWIDGPDPDLEKGICE